MSFRDKPKLSERMRGKSGDELINEIKKEFEDNKKAWFNNSNNPSFSSFRRENFPFEENAVFGKKPDAGIKSHLEDLAKKHPEFANDLRCPPWGGSVNKVDKSWENAFNIPVSVEKINTTDSQQSVSQSKPKMENDPMKTDLNHNASQQLQQQHQNAGEGDQDQKINPELKNTSSVSSSEQVTKQEPKRFTSKIEITPVNPFAENPNINEKSDEEIKAASNVRHVPVIPVTTSNNKETETKYSSNQPREIPIVAEKYHTRSESDQSPQMSRKHPQVRHIPIFVEGRSVPVVTKPTEDQKPETNNQFDQVPFKRKLDTSKSHNVSSASVPESEQQKQQELQKEKNSSESTSACHKLNNPFHCIEEVQNEVENLTNLVEQYSGNSRSDKKYLYLDEMLTRNLIKLDTVEVEGNDKLRSFRKDAIKSIQKAIALLESKVPSVVNVNEMEGIKVNDQESVNMDIVEENTLNSSNTMEIDNSQMNKNNEEYKVSE